MKKKTPSKNPRFATSWNDLATRLNVTRRAIQEWRRDPRFQEHCPSARADGRHDSLAWREFMVRFGLKRVSESAPELIEPERAFVIAALKKVEAGVALSPRETRWLSEIAEVEDDDEHDPTIPD